MNNLFLTNSLTRKKEIFKPINPEKISLYACGPTVYDKPHVGNARALVVFDLLFEVLKEIYGKTKVTYIRNITDIDDKIIETSKKRGISISELTNEITKEFHSNCESLFCSKPSLEPKATEHVKEMISMTENLIKLNAAYEKKGHVYFSITSFKNYGQLSNKKIDELKIGARVEVSDLKKDPLDFILWKPSNNNEPGWSSPWGRGRPGWHLECSVMSEKYLGSQFDIHGGGLDLIFPHHENEIAQSCVNNKTEKFANYWVHNGFVTFNKEKMSKSLGNIITISDAVKKYSGQVVRLALLSAHYSQPLDWNDELLSNQKNTIDKWYNLYEEQKNFDSFNAVDILLDDLNTPGFIAKIHELYNQANTGDPDKKSLFNSACRFIGLFNISKIEWQNLKKKQIKISEDYIESKIEERIKAKNNGNYDIADKIREELLNAGILIEDEKGKTKWRYK